jgi:ASC-1-like (ASCH) protein
MSDTVPSHQLNLRKPYLKLIADGIKTVEVRVGYPWRSPGARMRIWVSFTACV